MTTVGAVGVDKAIGVDWGEEGAVLSTRGERNGSESSSSSDWYNSSSIEGTSASPDVDGPGSVEIGRIWVEVDAEGIGRAVGV